MDWQPILHSGLPSRRQTSIRIHLVVHVGPPKTGTTTLQDAFETMTKQGILAKDNYVYERSLVIKLMDRRCHQQLSRQRGINKANGDAVRSGLRAVKCWNETLEALEPYRKSKSNIFYSGEPWSVDYNTIQTEGVMPW